MRYVPLVLTALLFIWTGAVYRFSNYGDWFVYPALLALPLTVLIHMVLVARSRSRARAFLYAVVHVALLLPLWLGCLMLISKDSL